MAEEEPARRYACPECEQVFDSPQGVALHRSGKHGYRRQKGGNGDRAAKTSVPSARGGIDLRAEGDKLVRNLTFVGTGVSMIFPHTGLTLISRAPDRTVQGVQKRGIASVVIGYAAKDERVAKGVQRFNAVFEGGEAAELVASLGAAVAVDSRMVDPHLEILAGTPMAFQPIQGLIGDVVEQVEELRAQEEPEPEEAEVMEPAPLG